MTSLGRQTENWDPLTVAGPEENLTWQHHLTFTECFRCARHRSTYLKCITQTGMFMGQQDVQESDKDHTHSKYELESQFELVTDLTAYALQRHFKLPCTLCLTKTQQSWLTSPKTVFSKNDPFVKTCFNCFWFHKDLNIEIFLMLAVVYILLNVLHSMFQIKSILANNIFIEYINTYMFISAHKFSLKKAMY